MQHLRQSHPHADRALSAVREHGSTAISVGDTSAQNVPRLPVSELPFAIADAYTARLALYYSEASGGPEEHPVYSDYDWKIECSDASGCSRDYWTWVATNIEQDRAMWPWDRESTPAVLFSQAAGVNVEQAPDGRWIANGFVTRTFSEVAFTSELDAWQATASAVIAAPQVSKGRTPEELNALPPTVLVHWIRSCVAEHGGKLQPTELPGKMREFERAANHWVQVAQTAGVQVTTDGEGAWKVDRCPDIPTVARELSYSSEVLAWRAAAVGLLQHLRQHLECSLEQWQAKSPGQHLELAKTFYADERPPAPDFAFQRHYEHLAKVLCQNVGWRVKKARDSAGEVSQGWQLNREGYYFTEAEAWLAGADRVRRLVMKKAKLSYLEWLSLSLDEQISMGLSHAR
jgi:hypothetical protein